DGLSHVLSLSLGQSFVPCLNLYQSLGGMTSGHSLREPRGLGPAGGAVVQGQSFFRTGNAPKRTRLQVGIEIQAGMTTIGHVQVGAGEGAIGGHLSDGREPPL